MFFIIRAIFCQESSYSLNVCIDGANSLCCYYLILSSISWQYYFQVTAKSSTLVHPSSMIACFLSRALLFGCHPTGTLFWGGKQAQARCKDVRYQVYIGLLQSSFGRRLLQVVYIPANHTHVIYLSASIIDPDRWRRTLLLLLELGPSLACNGMSATPPG